MIYDMATTVSGDNQDRSKVQEVGESGINMATVETTASASVSELGSAMFVLNVPAVRPLIDAERYPIALKWMMTGIVALCAAAAPLGSTILMRKFKCFKGAITGYIQLMRFI